MNLKFFVAGLAAVSMLAACGKNNDNNNNNSTNAGQSTRAWQDVAAAADCDSTVDPTGLCQNGQVTFTVNWDGSFSFDNGARKGNLSQDDLQQLVSQADPVAAQDATQAQTCKDSNSTITVSHTVSMAMTNNPTTPVVIYQEVKNGNQVCTRGDMTRLTNLRDLMTQLAAKYAVTNATPTPTPSPSATPMPTATPM